MDIRCYLLLVPLLAVCGISANELLDALDEDTRAMVHMLHDTCVEETKVDEKLIERAGNGDFVDDPVLKTYMACIFLQTGAMSEEGEVDEDLILSLIPEKFHDTAHKVADACRHISGSSPPEVAMAFNKCYYNTAPNMYVLI